MRWIAATRRGHFLILVLGVILGFPYFAFGHASLVKALPAPGSAVKAPSQINLWFNELLEEGFASITVVASTNAISGPGKPISLTRGKPVVDPHDGTHLSVTLEPLSQGTYVVEWRVLSRDGHTAPGRFQFHVTP